jgi:cytochrome oxidase Cu insertion factor (SCO1/SenC/PrrC family)
MFSKPRRMATSALAGILMSLMLVVVACSEDRELIGTDMESQPAPPFTLTDHRGETVELTDLRGKAVAMTFIFTNCPDVCPLIISRMNAAYEQIPEDKRDDVAMVAITVDPDRDDPEAMAEYLQTRSVIDEHNWYGLTGDIETLEPIWEAYFVTPGEQYPADPDVAADIEAGEHDHEEFMEEGLEASEDSDGESAQDGADTDEEDQEGHTEEGENTAYWLAHTDVIYAIDWENNVRVLLRSEDSPDDLANNLEILVDEIPDDVAEEG